MPDMRNDSLSWKPPAIDFIKTNFDGAFCASSLTGGVGIVVRDWRDTFLLARLHGCLAVSPLMTECKVARLTLSIAHDLGFRYLILEGDSLEIIFLLTDPHEEIHWLISSLIHDCINLLKTFIVLSCLHVKCCVNSVADHLAKHSAVSKTVEV